MADREGLLVISECAAVRSEYYLSLCVAQTETVCSLDGFSEELLETHLAAVTELYSRDNNHASVVMRSLANEPRSFRPEAGPYFSEVAARLRGLDPTRPLTAIMYDHGDNVTDFAAPHVDILGVNKYIGWYTDTGHLEAVPTQLEASLRQWR